MTKEQLMKEILQVIYTDSEEEKRLCLELLKISNSKQNPYACAFAYLYLFDSYSSSGNFSEGSLYLSKANDLCTRYGYDSLLVTLYNFAGLFFTHMNDEHTALDYYTKGLMAAKKLGDTFSENKLLGNLAMTFSFRGDHETAKEYFALCCRNNYRIAQEYSDTCEDEDKLLAKEHVYESLISSLCNYSETSLKTGDIEEARWALSTCKNYTVKSLYHQAGYLCQLCYLYSMSGEKELCLDAEMQVRNIILDGIDQSFFLSSMADSLVKHMITIDEKDRSWLYLSRLEKRKGDLPLILQYKLLCRQICFYEKYGYKEKADSAYKAYYNHYYKLSAVDSKEKAQSLMVKIQSTNLCIEGNEIRARNSALIYAGQQDNLTGLYNRKHFTELISKVTSAPSVHTLGFIMIDVDYFKEYNDFYGHLMGDSALKTVAQVLQEATVTGILVSRYGGDEFICLCINVSDETVCSYIEQVRQSLAAKKILHEKSKSGNFLTLSIGYCNESGIADFRLLNQTADEALYQVKQNGRNGAARKHITKEQTTHERTSQAL